MAQNPERLVVVIFKLVLVDPFAVGLKNLVGCTPRMGFQFSGIDKQAGLISLNDIDSRQPVLDIQRSFARLSPTD